MTRNNHCFFKGDVMGDIYYDLLKRDGKDVQFLRLYIFVKPTGGAPALNGLRVVLYGPEAELAYSNIHKGSRIAVTGHFVRRDVTIDDQKKEVYELRVEEIEYLRNINWEAGEKTRKDLVARGLLRPSYKDQDLDGSSSHDRTSDNTYDLTDITEDLVPDEFK